MSKLWNSIGRVVHTLGLPVIVPYLRFSHRTRIVVVCEDTVLVLKGWLGDGRWELPGGGLHRGETAIDGVLRELEEEVGVTLAASDISYDSAQHFRLGRVQFPYDLFIANVSHRLPLIKQRFEITTATWLPISQLTATTAGPDVLAGLSQLAARG